MYIYHLLYSIAITIYLSIFFKYQIKAPTISQISKAINGDKFNGKKICVITGTSSGLGKNTLLSLMEDDQYHVICAVRDRVKMETIAEIEGLNPKDYTIMDLDLASFSSVRKFANDLIELCDERPIDRLVCNAAVYQPTYSVPKWSEDNIEQQTQINYLSHYLLISLLLPELKKADRARCIMVGSVTGNDNTVGGGGVYPIANLQDLEGLATGAKAPIEMMDGRNFNGAKAYKDSKLAIMMLGNILHEKYHKSTGIAFSSIYPGCIAESQLFREKRPWFRKYFPVFMKYITGGFVSEGEAGYRLFQVITDPRCTRSGVYWGWNGGPRLGRGAEALENDGKISGSGGSGGGWDSIFENDPSDKVMDSEKQKLLWEYSKKVTGAEWMATKQPKSPCPTLRVISAVTEVLDNMEDLQRKRPPKTPSDNLAY